MDAGADGIYVTGTNVGGNVTVTSSSDVTAGGTGISATVKDGVGPVTISQTGNITSGYVGILVSTADIPTNIRIRSEGDISSGEFGVYVAAYAGGDIVVQHLGDIVSGIIGIDARNRSTAGEAGDVFVSMRGDITLTGDGFWDESIRAAQDNQGSGDRGSGDISVDFIGNIVNYSAGLEAGGIVAWAASGNQDVTFTGTIVANGGVGIENGVV